MITKIKLALILIISFLWSSLAVITGPLNSFLPAYHVISRSWARRLVCVSGIDLEVSGLENIDPDTNYVMVSNHASLFDIPILLSSIPVQIKMVAKKELAKIPVFGWSLVAGGYILIDRENPREALRALKKAEKKLKKGTSILVFPEGTRSPDGVIQEFKKGAFMVASSTKFDILPISVIGSHEVMPKKTNEINPTKVKVIVDKPISVKNDKSKKMDELIQEVRDIIIKNCQENPL